MKFNTQFNREPAEPTPAGSKEENKYEPRLKEDGSKTLKKVGKINIYDKIQAHKDETDIYKILELHDPNIQKQIIDISTINQGEVYDLRDIPKDLVQAKQMLVDAKKKFEALPLEVKKEFNNNMYEFISAAKNQETFKERLKKFSKQQEIKNVDTPQETTTTTPAPQTTTEGGTL